MRKKIFKVLTTMVVFFAASTNCFAADYVTAVVKDNLRFFLYNDNTATVTSYSGEPVEIIIPTTVEYSGSTYNVTAIGDNVFKGCKSLKKIKLNVQTIGVCTFESCTNLSEIDFTNVQFIGGGAFRWCKSISNLSCPDVIEVGECAFESSSLISITLPKAKSLSIRPFWYCESLKQIEIPEVTEIGKSAFSYCNSLKVANLPKVSVIWNSAFSNCPSLEVIEMPMITGLKTNSVNCPSLKIVKVGNTIIPIDSSTFDEKIYSTATLYVPTGMKEKYMQNENWAKFWNIEEYNLVGGVNDVQADASAAPATYYDLNGNKFDTPRQGINIVVDADGNASKQVFK